MDGMERLTACIIICGNPWPGHCGVMVAGLHGSDFMVRTRHHGVPIPSCDVRDSVPGADSPCKAHRPPRPADDRECHDASGGDSGKDSGQNSERDSGED